jgi:hypothetical protein
LTLVGTSSLADGGNLESKRRIDAEEAEEAEQQMMNKSNNHVHSIHVMPKKSFQPNCDGDNCDIRTCHHRIQRLATTPLYDNAAIS